MEFANRSVHQMELSDVFFQKIASGEKTVEGRINDEKRQKINIGDIIIFTNATAATAKIQTIVTDKKVFNTFDRAIREAKLKNILPGIRTYKEGVKLYHSIPGYAEKEKIFGTVILYLYLL